MQNRIAAALVALLALTSQVVAQGFPQTLPGGTVYGRMPGQGGKGQAIPFATLGALIATANTNASNISSGVLGSTFGGAGTINGIMQANGAGVVSRVTIGDKLSYGAGTLNIAPTANFIIIGSTNIGLGNTVSTITGLPTPTQDSDAATKKYVDDQGRTPFNTVVCATTGVLAGTPTYANGTLGVGATLTATSNGALSMDSCTIVNTNRVLVKDQAAPAQNGPYTITDIGSAGTVYVLTRATDADTAAELLGSKNVTVAAGGTANGGTIWQLAATVTTVGTTASTWSNLGSAGSASVWSTSGTAINKSNAGNVGIGGNSTPTSLLTVSGNATALPAGQAGTLVQAAAANGTGARVGLDAFGTNLSPVIDFRVARGTAASPTATQANDPLGAIAFWGYGASAYSSAPLSLFYSAAAENWTNSAQGTYFVFQTTPIGSATKAERLRITDKGDVGIGTSTPAFSGQSSVFLLTANPTAGAFGQIGVGGNATTPGDFLGGFQFINSSLGTTDKRLASISSQLGSVTNTADLQFYTWTAGVNDQRLRVSGSNGGQTNVVGNFAINADFVAGADITSALQTALNTYKNIVLPCGTFLLSGPINYALAGQQLHGCGREGTVLQVTGSAAISYIVNVTSLAETGMYDLTIDGNNATGLTGGCAVGTAAPKTKWIRVGCIRTTTAANNAAGFALVATSNTAATSSRWSEIRDCYLEDIQAINSSYNSHAILLSYADYSTVSGCKSVNIDNGINTQASNWVTVSNNVFVGNSSSASPTGFGGIRCSNGTVGATITGNTVRDMARGIFLLGCTNTAITGNSITNTQLQSILVSATTGNASPTQYNTISGNTMQDTCLGNACNFAIEFSSGGGGTQVGVVAIGNSYVRISTPVSTAMIGRSGGVSAGQNTCANNVSSITVGTC